MGRHGYLKYFLLAGPAFLLADDIIMDKLHKKRLRELEVSSDDKVSLLVAVLKAECVKVPITCQILRFLASPTMLLLKFLYPDKFDSLMSPYEFSRNENTVSAIHELKYRYGVDVSGKHDTIEIFDVCDWNPKYDNVKEYIDRHESLQV